MDILPWNMLYYQIVYLDFWLCVFCVDETNNDGLDIFKVQLKYPSNLVASIWIIFSLKMFSKFKILFFSKRKINWMKMKNFLK